MSYKLRVNGPSDLVAQGGLTTLEKRGCWLEESMAQCS